MKWVFNMKFYLYYWTCYAKFLLGYKSNFHINHDALKYMINKP